MFDLFSPTRDDLQFVLREANVNSLSLAEILVRKGLITQEEFSQERVRVRARLDQIEAGLKSAQASE
jgi:hypothetical protein